MERDGELLSDQSGIAPRVEQKSCDNCVRELIVRRLTKLKNEWEWILRNVAESIWIHGNESDREEEC